MTASEFDYQIPENNYRYEGMSEDETRYMTTTLVQREREAAKGEELQGRYICVEVDGTSPYANLGRQIEREVFEEAFGNDADQMAAEYGPYEERSRFFLSIDTEEMVPTGVLRVIEGDPDELKTLIDVQDPAKVSHTIGLDEVIRKNNIKRDENGEWEKCDDVGTVAVPKRFRGGGGKISIKLYRAWYLSAMRRDVQHVVSMIDKKPLESLRDFMGIPFEGLAGHNKGMSYLGSEDSYPVHGRVPEFYEKMTRWRWVDPRKLLARKVFALLVDGGDDSNISLLPTGN